MYQMSAGHSSESILITIDGETQPEVHFVDADILRALYQSPTLPDAMHNLTIAARGTASPPPAGTLFIDYFTVTAGKNTPLVGERLIVDESDPSVVFEGDWIQNTNVMLSDQAGQRYAYANTTHQTSSQGASATFHFNGTSVSVFGVSSDSLVDFGVEIDGRSVPYPSLAFQNSTNFEWYQQDGLSPTNHTLKMSLGLNGTLILDYIIYTPSFTSLAEKEGGVSIQPSSSSQGPSIQSSSSSQSQVTTTANGSQNSTTLSNHPGISSHATLLGAVIGSVLFGVAIIIIILFVMRRKKLLFWSSNQKPNTVDPFRLPHPQTQGISQLRIYHKSGTMNRQNVLETQIPDHDLPLVGTSATSNGVLQMLGIHRRSHRWARLWRRTEPGTVEAFPPDWTVSSSRQPIIVQQKPTLPVWHVAQQRASRQSDARSANETIIVDPQVQELQEIILSLQQEIEESRQDRSGAQNGALMREMVANRSESSNEHGQQGHGDHGSVAMSTTVV